MDLLNPGCIDLRNVKFKVEDEIDMRNNYKLLEGAFIKTSINKVSFNNVYHMTHHAVPVPHENTGKNASCVYRGGLAVPNIYFLIPCNGNIGDY